MLYKKDIKWRLLKSYELPAYFLLFMHANISVCAAVYVDVDIQVHRLSLRLVLMLILMLISLLLMTTIYWANGLLTYLYPNPDRIIFMKRFLLFQNWLLRCLNSVCTRNCPCSYSLSQTKRTMFHSNKDNVPFNYFFSWSALIQVIYSFWSSVFLNRLKGSNCARFWWSLMGVRLLRIVRRQQPGRDYFWTSIHFGSNSS